MHAEQPEEVKPTPVENVPAWHGVHPLAPLALEYVPVAQAVQTESPVELE